MHIFSCLPICSPSFIAFEKVKNTSFALYAFHIKQILLVHLSCLQITFSFIVETLLSEDHIQILQYYIYKYWVLVPFPFSYLQLRHIFGFPYSENFEVRFTSGRKGGALSIDNERMLWTFMIHSCHCSPGGGVLSPESEWNCPYSVLNWFNLKSVARNTELNELGTPIKFFFARKHLLILRPTLKDGAFACFENFMSHWKLMTLKHNL